MPQIEPIHQVFLNFYAALSYELLGQAAHLYSSTKISFLTAALDCFANCGAVLPEPMPLPKLPTIVKTPSPPSPPVYYPSTPRTPRHNLLAFDGGLSQSPRRDYLVRSITRLIDISLWDLEEDDPFMSDNEKGREDPFMLSLSPLARKPATKAEKDRLFRVMFSPTRTPAVKIKEPVKRNTTITLIPSPLRVRKISEDLGPRLAKSRSIDNISSSNSSPKSRAQSRSSNRPRLPPLPLRIVPATKLNIDAQNGDTKGHHASNVKSPLSTGNHHVQTPRKATTPTEPTEEVTPGRAAKVVRYNRAIETLRSQITANINSIQQHVDHVLDIQRTRRSRQMQRSISFWSFDPIKSENDVDEEAGAGKDREPTLDEFGNFLVKETKAQRIARLRSEGWETVGLRSSQSTWKGSQYYQEFCAMVMNEMYLDR